MSAESTQEKKKRKAVDPATKHKTLVKKRLKVILEDKKCTKNFMQEIFASYRPKDDVAALPKEDMVAKFMKSSTAKDFIDRDKPQPMLMFMKVLNDKIPALVEQFLQEFKCEPSSKREERPQQATNAIFGPDLSVKGKPAKRAKKDASSSDKKETKKRKTSSGKADKEVSKEKDDKEVVAKEKAAKPSHSDEAKAPPAYSSPMRAEPVREPVAEDKANPKIPWNVISNELKTFLKIKQITSPLAAQQIKKLLTDWCKEQCFPLPFRHHDVSLVLSVAEPFAFIAETHSNVGVWNADLPKTPAGTFAGELKLVLKPKLVDEYVQLFRDVVHTSG